MGQSRVCYTACSMRNRLAPTPAPAPKNGTVPPLGWDQGLARLGCSRTFLLGRRSSEKPSDTAAKSEPKPSSVVSVSVRVRGLVPVRLLTVPRIPPAPCQFFETEV